VIILFINTFNNSPIMLRERGSEAPHSRGAGNTPTLNDTAAAHEEQKEFHPHG
jgi:hypothetical protein